MLRIAPSLGLVTATVEQIRRLVGLLLDDSRGYDPEIWDSSPPHAGAKRVSATSYSDRHAGQSTEIDDAGPGRPKGTRKPPRKRCPAVNGLREKP